MITDLNPWAGGIGRCSLSAILQSRHLNVGPLYIACERYDLEYVGDRIAAIIGCHLSTEAVEDWTDAVLWWHQSGEEQRTDWYIETLIKCMAIAAGMFPPGRRSPEPLGRYRGLTRPSIEDTTVLLTPIDSVAGRVVNWWKKR